MRITLFKYAIGCVLGLLAWHACNGIARGNDLKAMISGAAFAIGVVAAVWFCTSIRDQEDNYGTPHEGS